MLDLWRRSCKDVDGRWEPVKSPDLFVWAGVNTQTGQVEPEDVRTYDDDLEDLVDGWEWRRFRLVPDNAEMAGSRNEDSADGFVETKETL